MDDFDYEFQVQGETPGQWFGCKPWPALRKLLDDPVIAGVTVHFVDDDDDIRYRRKGS